MSRNGVPTRLPSCRMWTFPRWSLINSRFEPSAALVIPTGPTISFWLTGSNRIVGKAASASTASVTERTQPAEIRDQRRYGCSRRSKSTIVVSLQQVIAPSRYSTLGSLLNVASQRLDCK